MYEFSLSSLSEGHLCLWCWWFSVWTPNFWISHKDVGFPLHLFLHSTISGRIPALAILSEFLFLVFCLKLLLSYPISQNGGEGLGKAPFLFLSAGPCGGGSCLWSPLWSHTLCSQLQLHRSPSSALNWNSCPVLLQGPLCVSLYV